MNKEIQNKLQEFISTNEPKGKKSVLHPYSDVIFILYDRNYTHKQISDFFKCIEIHVSRESVGEFIRKHSQLFTTDRSLPIRVSETDKLSVTPEPQPTNTNVSNADVLQMKRQIKKQFTHNPTGINNE